MCSGTEEEAKILKKLNFLALFINKQQEFDDVFHNFIVHKSLLELKAHPIDSPNRNKSKY